MKRTIFTFATATLLTTAGSASAEIVVQYTTAGGVNPLAASTVNANVTADGLTAGPGLNVQNFSTFNTSGWDTASTSFADAVAAGDFWTWGFDVTGSPIELTTMDIRLDRSGTGPDDFEIQASVNGGTAVSLLTHDYGDSTSGVNFTGVDLTGLGTVSAGDSIVFTLGAYNSESSGGTFDLETITFPGGTDSLTINGNVVPEPSSLALIGLGGLCMLRRRRK